MTYIIVIAAVAHFFVSSNAIAGKFILLEILLYLGEITTSIE